MSVSAIAVLSIARGIANAALLTNMRLAREMALYAAEAGIHEIVRQYREIKPTTLPTQYIAMVRNQRIDKKTTDNSSIGMLYSYPDITYSAYTIGDYIVIKASNPYIFGAGYYCIYNYIENWSRYTWYPGSVKVEWSGMNNYLRAIYIDGWGYSGNWASGQVIDISVANLQAGAKYQALYLAFQNDIPTNATIILTFSPGRSYERKAVILKNGYAGNNEFQITSTGMTNTSKGKMRRTLRATYDITTNRFTSWQEVDTHL
jgi:hypothetical protein